MSTMVAEQSTSVLDRSATLQQRTRRFSALYESHAYLIYNLALRITCERQLAIDASMSTFLSRVAVEDPEDGLLTSAVSQALAIAPAKPSPGGAGDEQTEALLASTARLAPPQRAVLALRALADSSPTELAGAMALDEHSAARLRLRAENELASILGQDREAAVQSLHDWLWAEPPPAIWETLYPAFYQAVKQLLHERSEQAPAPKEVPAESPRKREKRIKRLAAGALAAARHPRSGSDSSGEAEKRRRRWPWILTALVLIPGGAMAATGGGGLLPTKHSSAPATFATPPSSYSQMSPQQLDRLRLQELQQTQAYAARQKQSQLSVAQQAQQRAALIAAQQQQAKALAKAQAQQRKAAALRARQQTKQQAQQQALLLAQQQAQQQAQMLALQRAAANANRPAQTKQPATTPPPSSSNNSKPTQKPSSSTGSGQGGNQSATQKCMLNADTGTYVCPSH